MTNILLLYPPFCTPASPPYSITNIASFLKENLNDTFNVNLFDANVFCHVKIFKEYHDYIKNETKENINFEEYEKKTKEYRKISDETYSKNTKKVIGGENPVLFDEIILEIIKKKPNIVCISVVYSSQVPYTFALLKELKKRNIKTIIGGPAVSEKIIEQADIFLKNKEELFVYISENKEIKEKTCVLDFSSYNLEKYFLKEIVYPVKTTNSCPYKKCAFCTHHQSEKYFEFDLGKIKDTIKKNNQKYLFITDDMLTKKRIIELSEILEPLNVKWMCQLSPKNDFDFGTLKKLHTSGLRVIMWGMESGSDKILTLMKKGTNKKDIENVLLHSHKAGIINVTFTMFGFPNETKEDFLETIEFLKKNEENIDLICTSIFGLQKNSDVFNNPENYNVLNIKTKKRTLLDESISYELLTGLSQEEASDFRRKYKKTVEKINKFPKEMNHFREHLLYFS
ncbi:MAG: B12-binding domain-containing radical SAM protein [Candidatus Woesearchaeota archaeon]|jgi:hypothetical protein